jgi:geranylgeranyl reductase family protein
MIRSESLKTLKFTNCASPTKLRGLLLIYDVAIVGAGPAGASAAYTLDNTDYNIVLIDKEEFPRSKPCAGVLPPRIFSELQIPEYIVERPLDGYRLISPSGMVVESHFPKPGIIVRRGSFDNFLVDRLGCKLTKMRILNSEVKNDFVLLKGKGGSIQAKMVVAADGANSLLRKVVFEDDEDSADSTDSAMAMQYEISLPNQSINEHIGNWFEVYYTFSQGYGWISPLSDAIKVGVGGVSLRFKKDTKKILDDFLEKEEIKKKIAGGKIVKTEAHHIPMKGPCNELAWNRMVFCGDAGGFVFPGTGEGVFYAIKSGRIAAEIIKEAFDEQKCDSHFLQTKYTDKLEKNGLISLRDVDFIENVLSSPENAEQYLRRLKKLNEIGTSPSI